MPCFPFGFPSLTAYFFVFYSDLCFWKHTLVEEAMTEMVFEKVVDKPVVADVQMSML